MARWVVDPAVRVTAASALVWARAYLGAYDLSNLDWVRIDLGRIRPGQRAPQGVYGRCWYGKGRGKARTGCRISCQVPGPFPSAIHLRLPPLYVDVSRHYGQRPDHLLDDDGSAVFEMGYDEGRPYWDVASQPRPSDSSEPRRNGQRAWWTRHGETILADRGEAIAWIIGHEAFHFLRRTRQVPGINNEIQADAAGDAALARYRQEAA